MKSDADDRPRNGMLSQHPMARCSACDQWSYVAAIAGICFACAASDSPDEVSA